MIKLNQLKKIVPKRMVSGVMLFCIMLSGSSASDRSKQDQKVKLIYVYDALCGWCYGFSPVIAQFHREFGADMDIQIVSGGLRVGERVGTINEVAPFIKTAYRTVEEKTGIKFGEQFINGPLKNGSMRLNSLPPAIALAIVRKKQPEKALAFSEALHKMYYVDGIDPEDISSYGTYVASFGFDPVEFLREMQDQENILAAKEDFRIAENLGVTGFPAVFIEKNGKLYPITNGYSTYPELKSRYLQIKSQ